VLDLRTPLPVTASTLRDQDSLVYRFDPGTEGAFWLARQLCEQWLLDRHVRHDAVCDLLVVLTELCAVSAPSGGLVLRTRVDGDAIVLTVESGGTAAIVIPDDDDVVVRPGGDLRLAAALCDELVLRVTPDQTVVTARRHGIVLPD
jgi:hypothetical protein